MFAFAKNPLPLSAFVRVQLDPLFPLSAVQMSFMDDPFLSSLTLTYIMLLLAVSTIAKADYIFSMSEKPVRQHISEVTVQKRIDLSH